MVAASTAAFDSDLLARRRLRTGLVGSLGLHAAMFALLQLSPRVEHKALLPIVSVELVAAAPAGPAAPARSTPAPARAAPPAKPIAKKPIAKKKVLPKTPSPRAAKPKPARPQPARREPPKELGYEDALASLRQEMGEEVSASPLTEARRVAEARNAERAASEATAQVDRVLESWVLATRAHVRRAWVTPPEFLNRGLQTDLLVTLLADGTVLGSPEIVRPSGDPYFDENAVRALRRASPLPRPPEAGDWPFRFEPGGR